jgi:hypothetical protein
MSADDDLLLELLENGQVAEDVLDRWHDALPLLAIFDAIGRDGASALIKVDGARPARSIYTVVVSGGRLGDASFRRDGGELSAMLREAIAFYRERAWPARGD